MNNITTKIQNKGVKSLTTEELLKATNLEFSGIYEQIVNFVQENEIEYNPKNKKLTEALCMIELINRIKYPKQKQIKTTSDAVGYFMDYKDKKQEYFLLLTLDGANQVIKLHEITKGLANKTQVHPREVFAPAIEDRACFIIVAHNHPSGSLEASREDLAITEKIKHVGDLMGIKMLDHIIVSKEGYLSIMSLLNL